MIFLENKKIMKHFLQYESDDSNKYFIMCESDTVINILNKSKIWMTDGEHFTLPRKIFLKFILFMDYFSQYPYH